MKIKVTDQGIVIPKDWFEGVEQVEIYKENEMIIVITNPQKTSIWNLGKSPVSSDIKDASVNHDYYLYDNS